MNNKLIILAMALVFVPVLLVLFYFLVLLVGKFGWMVPVAMLPLAGLFLMAVVGRDGNAR